MRKKLFILLFGLSMNNASFSQLVLNEVSQGLAGAQEYVELLVVGTGQCNSCVDLRGWVIDDNNGWHVNPVGSGQGIAAGCVRFTQNVFWSCVPAGTLIVIYNFADANPLINLLDNSLTDNNCKLILYISNAELFESNATIPNISTTGNYSTLTYTAGANWNFIGMANSDDSFQIIAPGSPSSPYFSVGWGSNTLAQNVYFSGTGTGKVIYMANAVDNNPFNSANWINGNASTTQTPGTPNNAANAAWINSLNNNCTIPAPLEITSTLTNIICNGDCNGTATVTASGGTLPYTYTWSGSASGQTSSTATGLCAGNYQVTVQDGAGCIKTILSSNILITEPPALNLNVQGSWSTCNCNCAGVANAFPSGGTPTYNVSWSNGYNGQFQNGVCAGTYTVTVVDANGCTQSGTVTIGP